MSAHVHTDQATHARQLYMGSDTDRIQRRLGTLRRLRAQLEAEHAAHPQRATAVALAAVYSELSVAMLSSLPFDTQDD